MTITAITQTTVTAPTPAPKAAALGTDYETFLKMLTVQMQNQDPLNPIESSDYAVQLATFSGVEQQMKTNELLGALGSQFGLIGMAQLAGWVGQEARAAVPVWMDGTPVTLSPEPADLADQAVLVVRDAAGTLVSREDLPVSDAPYQWLGADAAGDPLPEGLYSLSLESYSQGALVSTTPMQSYARILEAQGGAAGTTLLLEGGVRVAAADVTALRMP